MTDKKNLRFYAFGNFYLSSIQQGIQAQHTLGEMALKYKTKDGKEAQTFWDYLEHGKTSILLNGGAHDDLGEIIDAWNTLNHRYKQDIPVACFHEEQGTLNGALTCVGVVLDEVIYEQGVATLRARMKTYEKILAEQADPPEHFNELRPLQRLEFLNITEPFVMAASLLSGYGLAR